jgi:hypothetical protein
MSVRRSARAFSISPRNATSRNALGRAIAATFARRKTEVPAQRPDALSRAFAEDPLKQRQWDAFLQDVTVKSLGSLANVIDELADR